MIRTDLATLQVSGTDLPAFLDRLLPLLDGSRDREGLAAALPGYSRASVAAFLDLLEARGLVEPVPEAPSPLRGQAAFLRACPEAPGDAMSRIVGARVVVLGSEPWGRTAAGEIAAAGVSSWRWATRDPLGDRPDLLVAAVPPGDVAEIERVARLAHEAGIVSLWAHRAGAALVLGPLVTPGRTACRVCAGAEALNPALAHRGDPALPEEGMDLLLGHLVALEAVFILAGCAPSLGGRARIEDLATQGSALHALVRLPWCPVCGEA
jgi:hypothetical protein